jgi:hypothetical protein
VLSLRLLLWCASFLLFARVAGAEPSQTVVVVQTKGARAWHAAERRLLAELQAMGMRLIQLRYQRELDKELPKYAKEYGALASLQVLRNGEQGVIRIWLEADGDLRAGYRHISVNLRNPDVVSYAVLPAVELVYTRSVQLRIPKGPAKVASQTATSAETSDEAAESKLPSKKAIGAPVWGPPVRYHVRSEMPRALRFATGPWFSGAENTPAFQVSFGYREHFAKRFSVEGEVFIHAVEHRVATPGGVGHRSVFGGRAHLMFEPWPKSAVSVGVGPGVGIARVAADFPANSPATQYPTLVSGRAQIASATAPFVDFLFAVTISHSLSSVVGESVTDPGARLMRPSVDAMLGLDWHL